MSDVVLEEKKAAKRKLEDNVSEFEKPHMSISLEANTTHEDEANVDEDFLPVISPFAKRKEKQEGKRTCPYLDTINRAVLDFDFEKLCSISLSNLNVYACLVCGKYFQGRGRHSHAYFHALHMGHQVFMNLHSSKFYCLPDDYEIIDSSLDDIKYCLNPTFNEQQIAQFDTIPRFTRAQDGSEYLPGVVGLNNIKKTDYLNVIIQALNRASGFRNFFARHEKTSQVNSNLVQAYAELVRKIWNPRNFRSHVSPHELLQAITLASGKKFSSGVQSDPIEFLSWLLNTLHKDLGGSKKPKSSIIFESFQGEVKITTEKIKPRKPADKDQDKMDSQKESAAEEDEDVDTEVVQERKPFLFLTLDIPPPPLFKDELERNVIPNITMTGEKKKYVLTKLPKYLILHLKRFKKNNFFMEKNPTIVTFPVKNLEMKDYLEIEDESASIETKYDLLASICHEGEPGKGTYHVHIFSKPHDQWFDMRDLICTEVLPQLITLSEAYVQIYERKA